MQLNDLKLLLYSNVDFVLDNVHMNFARRLLSKRRYLILKQRIKR